MGETRREWVLETSPNPIITVTEHTPVPSPEFMRHKVRVLFSAFVISVFIS